MMPKHVFTGLIENAQWQHGNAVGWAADSASSGCCSKLGVHVMFLCSLCCSCGPSSAHSNASWAPQSQGGRAASFPLSPAMGCQLTHPVCVCMCLASSVNYWRYVPVLSMFWPCSLCVSYILRQLPGD